jgi:SAM-dependent methyltransferase
MLTDIVAQERTKYEAVWSLRDYKEFSPGLENVERFMKVVNPVHPAGGLGRSLYDVGCGAGVAGLAFEERGFRVTYVDLTDAGLDPRVDRTNFIKAPIWTDWMYERHSYAFCCDVMEHIPTEFVMLSLSNIIRSATLSWINICNMEDKFGDILGEPLHLTVRPFNWWRDRIRSLGTVIEARDLCGTSLFVVTP